MFKGIHNRFNNLKNRQHIPQNVQQMRSSLLEESTLELNYIVLILGSCLIATLGLLSNSAAVIIGAMIVAPLMLPIRGLAFGALEGNILLFRKAAISIGLGTVLAIFLALIVGLLVGFPEFGSEVIARSQPTLLDLGIAVVAGGISGFAKVQPKIAETLAGTAIAVALMPPICVIGLGLSQGNFALSSGATLLYLTNLLGITLACMLIFLISGYTRLYRARRGLIWTTILTTIITIPLGVSFFQLTRQTRLEASVRRALVNRTITFQRLVVIKSDVNWQTSPPQVRLNVRAKGDLTPRQVQLLEEFIAQEMGQEFHLVFEVAQVEEIRSTKP